jgi:nitrous oxidase accessory protein
MKNIQHIATIFLVFILAGLNSVTAQRVQLSSGEIFSTLTQAVEESAPGDTLYVEEGVYREYEIQIEKPLTIIGSSGAIIDGEGQGSIFIIGADDVTLKGLDIRNTGRSYVHDYAAILLVKSSGFLIENNTLDNVFFGIYLAETRGGEITGNRIESYDRREASSGNGIHLWNSREAVIRDNIVTGMRDGIYLEFAEDVRITGNLAVDNNRYGLHYMFSDGGIYVDNTFRKNGAGVAVMYSENIEMRNNLFEHNWGTSAYGLLLKDIRNSTIEGNRFYRNTVAIYSESSSNVEIVRNHIELNGWAVNIKSSSARNHFRENNFIENSFDVRTDSPRNNNLFEGNYWSGYEGYDLDRDGTGDVPYRPVSLFSIVIDRQPESLILMRSLFIHLLDMAERVAPVLTPQTLMDEQPQMNRIQ